MEVNRQKTQQPLELSKELLKNTRKSILLFCHVSEDLKLTIKPEVMEFLKDDQELMNYLNSVIKTIPTRDNPSEISDFNYCYTDGKLVNMDTGKPFHWVNQSHYDALGDTIVKHIQSVMVKDYGLQEILLPIDPEYNGPKCNIFVSEDYLTSNTLVLLIQGAGAVRAGQWARALCINENLSIGTIFPYLQRCKEAGYGVIVFNPNLNGLPEQVEVVKREQFLTTQNVLKKREKMIKIKDNENYVNHGLYVWEHFVSPSSAAKIVIVAHSRGGDNTIKLIEHKGDEFKQRVAGVAFTDSVHHLGPRDDRDVIQYVKENAKNWVTSSLPMGTPVSDPQYDCPRVSAGHKEHEYTSGCAIEGVFEFLQEKLHNFK